MRGALVMSLVALSEAAGSNSAAAKKAVVRTRIKETLKTLSAAHIEECSTTVANTLQSMPEWSSSKVMCLYLSMTQEIQTYRCIQKAFDDGKRVFIPKVTGKLSEDMVMFELDSYAAIGEFPKSKWGIPEPSERSTDGTYAGIIDTVIVPLCAYDATCGRIGHGKGYYGEWRVTRWCSFFALHKLVVVLEYLLVLLLNSSPLGVAFWCFPCRLLSRPRECCQPGGWCPCTHHYRPGL
jgi:5-formyltetrahydrofolate cyclo-ligase